MWTAAQRAGGMTLVCWACLVPIAGGADQALSSPSQQWSAEGPAGSPDFIRHIVPLLGKQGCNNRACHGSFQGQTGFRLSLFGFEPQVDRSELLEDEGDGPRVNVQAPDESLALRKPSEQVEHDGGLRLEQGSWQYRMFRQWIADGARYDPAATVALTRLEVIPAEIVFATPGEQAALRAVAWFADGSREDVTDLTMFTSNDTGVAEVDESGNVRTVRTGDTSVVAQYSGGVASARVLVPWPDSGEPQPPFPPHNEVDEFVLARLRKLNLPASPLSSDDVFLRRVYLDVIGTLPTADEARTFLADRDPDKRARLIDSLLARPEYAMYWGMKFSDWTGNGPYPQRDPTKANWMWQLWLEDKLARNVPYDDLVRRIVCATSPEGRPREQYLEEVQEVLRGNEGRGQHDDGIYARREMLDMYWIKVQHRDLSTIALQTANAFLGLRLECAQCHNHPFDRWTQRDYETFKSIFAYVRYCEPATGEEKSERDRGYGRESVEPGLGRRNAGHVRKMPPTLLGGAEIDPNVQDPREALWKWMRAEDNPYFAQSLVNRLWAHYFGRGLVHPADDFNQGNPPSDPELLDWLASDFRQRGFDLHHVHRTILNSRAYQLAWQPQGGNQVDTSGYSHAVLRRLPAEVLMDAVAQVTGVPDQFSWVPPDRTRAVGQASPAVRHSLNRAAYPMIVFGRPDREKTCDCERSNEPSVAQAMYLVNDQQMHVKLADPGGRLAQLVRTQPDDGAVIEELYLAALSRYPTAEELVAHREHVAAADSRFSGMQDVLWSLLNVREFLFNH